MKLSYSFPTDYVSISDLLEAYGPAAYAGSRNYVDGAVSEFSPYISRGVLSTRRVYEHLVNKGHEPKKMEKFLQELAWRDYWQLIWMEQGMSIDQNLRYSQGVSAGKGIPHSVLESNTGIIAIDAAIRALVNDGHMHNHLRMYVASICCNVANAHWLKPAQWMYYHLLDGDWASNALSWQWVAGTFSNRNYIANQENINKYCHTEDTGTFLDKPYDAIASMDVPEVLQTCGEISLVTPLPNSISLDIDPDLPTYIYNWYNLDPLWDTDIEANRILLLEPAIFEQYPISKKSLEFMLALSRNILGIQVYVGSFDALKKSTTTILHFKEHPLNRHYQGVEHSRDWLTSVRGEYRSFFQYWKKAQKELY